MAERAYSEMFMDTEPRFSQLIFRNTLGKGKLAIPKWFVEEYGSRLSDTVLFLLPNGVQWSVKLFRSGQKIWFYQGWPEFAEFCKLSLGFFLIFQYLGSSSFLVVIFSCTGSEICYPGHIETVVDGEKELPPKQLTTVYKTRARARAEARFRTANPSFMLVMMHSFIDPASRNRVHLPIKFVKEHFKRSEGEALVQLAGGRTWNLGYSLDSKAGYVKASFKVGSWHAFVKDTNLKVGDVCAFELMEGVNLRFRVTIIRADELADRYSAKGIFEKGESSRNMGSATITDHLQ